MLRIIMSKRNSTYVQAGWRMNNMLEQADSGKDRASKGELRPYDGD